MRGEVDLCIIRAAEEGGVVVWRRTSRTITSRKLKEPTAATTPEEREREGRTLARASKNPLRPSPSPPSSSSSSVAGYYVSHYPLAASAEGPRGEHYSALPSFPPRVRVVYRGPLGGVEAPFVALTRPRPPIDVRPSLARCSPALVVVVSASPLPLFLEGNHIRADPYEEEDGAYEEERSSPVAPVGSGGRESLTLSPCDGWLDGGGRAQAPRTPRSTFPYLSPGSGGAAASCLPASTSSGSHSPHIVPSPLIKALLLPTREASLSGTRPLSSSPLSACH